MILKLGSKGEQVKQLQRFLGLVVDGDFGPKTEAAVKKWQQDNKLVVDGIVGTQTWNAMGFVTTDVADQNKISDNVMIRQHYLPKGQYFDGPTKKKWLFLHHTAGWENPYNTVNNWARDTRGAVATEFVLGGQKITNGDSKHDGEVVQAFPAGGYAWHLGVGNTVLHRNSVGIEVCNFGQIVDGKTYVGTVAHQSQIVTLKKSFRGFTSWHRYSNKQIESLRDLILFIANRDSIDVREGLPNLIRKMGVDAFDVFDIKNCENTPGLWNHTNVMRGKVDMFPQQELVDMLLSL
jgi:hypothetical protein